MFNDEFFEILGAWQNGWKEDQNKRIELAKKMLTESQKLPDKFKQVNQLCYRKRFLHNGELFEIIMCDTKHEGMTSWTIDKTFAEIFKGMEKENAVSAAIFEHIPIQSEVILNICDLWKDSNFQDKFEKYKQKQGKNWEAIFNFKADQGEVILHNVPLRGSEIVSLTGESSPIDDIFDYLNIEESKRDEYYKELVKMGNIPSTLKYIDKEATQRVIQNVIKIMEQKINLTVLNSG
jgi:hypothetical protein